MEHIVGAYKSRLFKIWDNMKQRCCNENSSVFQYYGGKGISVCHEWSKSFDAFYKWSMENGYNDELQIDRVDVSGNYCPENCRWITRKEQQRNRTNNHVVSFNGKTRTLAEWEEITGIDAKTLQHRLSRDGWSIEDALTKPKRRYRGGE